MKLFQENGLDIPCSLVTDSDPSVTEEEKQSDPDGSDLIEYPERLGRVSATAQRLKEFESGQVRVFLASKTFEYDLALTSASNAMTMTTVYKDKLGHPDIGQRIEADLGNSQTYRERAKAFFVPSIEKYPREKGVFSQKLATHLESENLAFAVPVYIQDAVYHSIDVYTLYINGLSRFLSLIGSEHPSHTSIKSKQDKLEKIVSRIREHGIDEDLRNELTSLVTEVEGVWPQESGQSFNQFCGLG